MIQERVFDLLHRKAVDVDFAFYDKADFHDLLYRARSEAAAKPQVLLELAGSLLQSGVMLAAMAASLAAITAWLPVLLAPAACVALYLQARSNRQYHCWWESSTQERRRSSYYDHLLTSGSTAAEIRQFGLGDVFRRSYQQVQQKLRGERLDLLRRQGAVRLCAHLISGGVVAGAMLWMLRRTLDGAATLGQLVLFYQILQRGHGQLQSLLAIAGQLYGNALYLGDLFRFLDLPSSVKPPERPVVFPTPVREGIILENVSFRYPGASCWAVRNLNMHIPAGRITAIVGENGAGKSTVIKLLCRLYDPQDGSIRVDGVDLRDVEIGSLIRSVGVLFQTPVTYQATVEDNIDPVGRGSVTAEVQRAAKCAGAEEFIQRLPQGYDTLLGKWFDSGVELSAGEWQRIATARALLGRPAVLLLDEPTSFLDAWAEPAWIERIRAWDEAATIIIITHRFSIARQADQIYVLRNGALVESGRHDHLIAAGRHYAGSWQSQMQSAAPPLRAGVPS
jgi:ATP-binding cassette subfamily B protein